MHDASLDARGFKRGVIRDKGIARRINDFRGMRYGTITPTDIDMMMEFGDRLFVIGETKYNGAPVPTGQRLCIERLVDRLQASGAEAIGIIADYFDKHGDIDTSSCIVRQFRYRGKWREGDGHETMRELVDRVYTCFFA